MILKFLHIDFEVIHKKPSLIKPIKIDLFDDSSKIMRTKSEIDGENINEESITEKSELISKKAIKNNLLTFYNYLLNYFTTNAFDLFN